MSKKSFSSLYINNTKSWVSFWYSNKLTYNYVFQENILFYIYFRSLLIKSVFENINKIKIYHINKIFILNVIFDELRLRRKTTLYIFFILNNLNLFFQKKIYFYGKVFQRKKVSALALSMRLEKLIKKRFRLKSKLIRTILEEVKMLCNGIYVQCAGRINNRNMAKVERIYFGSVSLSSINTNLDYTFLVVNTMKGLQSIKIWIYK